MSPHPVSASPAGHRPTPASGVARLLPRPRAATRVKAVQRFGAVTAALLLAGLVAGCSAGSTASSSSGVSSAADSGARGGSGGVAQPGTGKAAPSGSGGTAGSDAVNQVVAAERKITRSASLSVQVKDIATAAATVRGITAGADGFVLNEQLGGGGPQPVPDPSSAPAFGGFGTISVSVPTEKLDAVLDQLSRVGRVLSRTTSSQDVTDQYVDTASRVKTMTASLDRVRALLARATTIGEVVSLESELTRREADLESLQAQLAALKGSVERSTVTITLSTPAVVAAQVDDTGFLAGLKHGWRAFQASVTAVLTVLGAVLPFAVLALLLGWPTWKWLRRRQAGPAATGATASPAPGAPAAP